MQITVSNYFNVACGTCAPGYFNDQHLSAFRRLSEDHGQAPARLRHRLAASSSLTRSTTSSPTVSGPSPAAPAARPTRAIRWPICCWANWPVSPMETRSPTTCARQVFAGYAQDTYRAHTHLTSTSGLAGSRTFPTVDKQCRGNQFSLAEFLAGYHSTQYPRRSGGPAVRPRFAQRQRLRVRRSALGRLLRRASAWSWIRRATGSKPSAPRSR